MTSALKPRVGHRIVLQADNAPRIDKEEESTPPHPGDREQF